MKYLLLPIVVAYELRDIFYELVKCLLFMLATAALVLGMPYIAAQVILADNEQLIQKYNH